MTPNWKPECKPTYHRDGTVSYWDVFLQQWARRPAQEVTEAVQSSHDDAFRRRVATMAAHYHRQCAERCIPDPRVEYVDGCLVTRGEDPETGNLYVFIYRSDGRGMAELWRDLPDQEACICPRVYTPIWMLHHTADAIEAGQQVAQ